MAKDNYYSNLEKYVISIIHAKRMLNLGIFDENDFNKIDNKLRKKYCIKNNSIYVTNDWINNLFRGNMCHDKRR